MLRKIYLSPFGIIISYVLRAVAIFQKPFMVYGYYDKASKKFLKHTRISSTAILINKKNIQMANNIWIGHYCLVDGTGSVKIGEGVNISSHTTIYSHSSNDALRLLGRNYIKINSVERPGYILKPVIIGEYTFIGTSSIVLPGVTIGKGCIIGAGSVVNHNIPDYAIVYGNPAKIHGDTRERDNQLYSNFINSPMYYQNI
jgi:acetyltransferase-like isoleucine patch superfamily enzyme